MVSEHELDRFRDVELDGWRRLAAGYAQHLADLMSQAIEPLLDAAGIAAGGRVLDLCCGPGQASAAIRRRGATPLGLDFAPEMIALAKEKWPGLAFEVGDAENLAQPDSYSDAVVMNFGLLHLARPEAALRHVARVLKPGGRFAFTVWATPADSVGHRIILGALNAHGTMEVGLPAGPPLFRFADPQECTTLFAGTGLTDMTFRKLQLRLDVPAPDGLFDAYTAGAVRIAVILARQSPEALSKIRDAVRAACAEYEKDGMLGIPMTSVLVSGRRP
jgi:ubiquinone/menaquinone biosynthesis C-methylase UbiE